MGFLWYRHASLEDLLAEGQQSGPHADTALNEIVRRFEPLVKKLGKKYAQGRPHRPDVENAARYALTRAVERHQGQGATFPGYARSYMTGAALREARAWAIPAGYTITNVDDVLDVPVIEQMTNPAEGRRWGTGNTADAIRCLSPERQDLLRRRYIEDAELADIAADSGTSVAAVSQRLSTTHRHIRERLAA